MHGRAFLETKPIFLTNYSNDVHFFRLRSVFNNLNPVWSTIINLEGHKFGVPFYIEVGVFDFNAKQSGTSERQLQLNDAHTNLNIVSDASSRHLLRNGKFPHRVMGTALFEVGEILGSRGNVASNSLLAVRPRVRSGSWTPKPARRSTADLLQHGETARRRGCRAQRSRRGHLQLQSGHARPRERRADFACARGAIRKESGHL